MGHTIYPIWFYAPNKDLNLPSTIKEITGVTQLNIEKARHAQIEPYCYKSTLALMPKNAKTDLVIPEHQSQLATDYRWQN